MCCLTCHLSCFAVILSYFQLIASASQAGGSLRTNVTSSQLIQSRGWRRTHFVWGKAATWWAFRTFKSGWETNPEHIQLPYRINKCSSIISHTVFLHFSVIFLVMGEDTNQLGDLLDRPKWPHRGKCLGVEWWESFYRIPIVRYTFTAPIKFNHVSPFWCRYFIHNNFLNFRFWMPGQPDNWNNDEHCGQVVGSQSGQWNDENCNTKRKYICKYINCK